MVSRRGQPSSHSPHGVQEGSAFFPLLMVLFRRGQPSPHSPLLYHIVLFSPVHTVTCIGTDVSAHVHVRLRCVHTERKPMRKRSLSHIQLSKKIFVFTFVLARCKSTLIKLGIWCLIFIFLRFKRFLFFQLKCCTDVTYARPRLPKLTPRTQVQSRQLPVTSLRHDATSLRRYVNRRQ